MPRDGQSALVVDDHAITARGIATLLMDEFGFSDVRAVGSVEEGLEAATLSPIPALLILDLGLPGLGGPDGVEAFRAAFPTMRIIVLSGYDDSFIIEAVMKAGADAFVSKGRSDDSELISVINDAIESLDAESIDRPDSSEKPILTPRQREVLQYLTGGKTNKEIARALEIAVGTIKIHLAGVYAAVGARNRTEAVFRAKELGLIDIGQSEILD